MRIHLELKKISLLKRISEAQVSKYPYYTKSIPISKRFIKMQCPCQGKIESDSSRMPCGYPDFRIFINFFLFCKTYDIIRHKNSDITKENRVSLIYVRIFLCCFVNIYC